MTQQLHVENLKALSARWTEKVVADRRKTGRPQQQKVRTSAHRDGADNRQTTLFTQNHNCANAPMRRGAISLKRDK
jgi:hypothetical protein